MFWPASLLRLNETTTELLASLAPPVRRSQKLRCRPRLPDYLRNAVAPGPVWTPLQVCGGQPTDKLPEFGANTPMGRPASPPSWRQSMSCWPRRRTAMQRARCTAPPAAAAGRDAAAREAARRTKMDVLHKVNGQKHHLALDVRVTLLDTTPAAVPGSPGGGGARSRATGCKGPRRQRWPSRRAGPGSARPPIPQSRGVLPTPATGS